MADQGHIHHHYWPGEDLVPITPQAKRFGYVFPVYVTRNVWNLSIAWKQGKNTHPDKRIYELLDSCWKGMGKALSSEPERVMYEFKHWYWRRERPKATKQARTTFASRLLLDPETEEPWMLIFHPNVDGLEVLQYGEPETNRGNESGVGELPDPNGAELDPGVRVEREQDAPERNSEGSIDELAPAATGD